MRVHSAGADGARCELGRRLFRVGRYSSAHLPDRFSRLRHVTAFCRRAHFSPGQKAGGRPAGGLRKQPLCDGRHRGCVGHDLFHQNQRLYIHRCLLPRVLSGGMPLKDRGPASPIFITAPACTLTPTEMIIAKQVPVCIDRDNEKNFFVDIFQAMKPVEVHRG